MEPCPDAAGEGGKGEVPAMASAVAAAGCRGGVAGGGKAVSPPSALAEEAKGRAGGEGVEVAIPRAKSAAAAVVGAVVAASDPATCRSRCDTPGRV